MKINEEKAEVLWMSAIWGMGYENGNSDGKTYFGELVSYEGLKAANYYKFINDGLRDEVARFLREMADGIEKGKGNDT